MAMLLQCGVDKQGFKGLPGELMAQDAIFTVSKFLSLLIVYPMECSLEDNKTCTTEYINSDYH